MRRRFAINEHGDLVDRDGYVLGRIVAVTLDVREGGALKGGLGAAVEVDVPLDENNPLPPSLECQRCGTACEPSGRCPTCAALPASVLPHSVMADEIRGVWAHYVEVMEPRRKELDPASAQLIRDALKVATADECKAAIDGCRASSFHMGENDRGKKYNRLSQILKGKRGVRTLREQIDLFLDVAEKSGVRHSDPSVDPARLREAKRNVLTAWEFPHSEQAQKAGDMSAAWLAQHGYTVERDPASGRPTFRRAA